MTYVTIGFGVLLVVVMALLAWGGRRQSGGIILPVTPVDGSGVGEDQESRLSVVGITPETVKLAVGTLSRPAAYRRTQVVETFWSGGSGTSATQVYVSGGRTRLDTDLPDGSVRRTLVVEDAAYVWYDDETEWERLQSASFTADAAGRMLTYETVRDLPAGTIAQADYRELDGGGCVYVETLPDEEGYVDRYWVSAADGLLAKAERLYRGTLIYRFTASGLEVAAQEEELFRLPDGTQPS